MTKEQLIGCYSYEEGIIKLENKEVYLTKTENKLMNILIHNYNKFIKKDFLCKELYDTEMDDGLNFALTTCVSRLRTKLKKIATIKRKNNFGYKLEVIEDED